MPPLTSVGSVSQAPLPRDLVKALHLSEACKGAPASRAHAVLSLPGSG